MSGQLDAKVNPVLILDDDVDRHKGFRHFYENQGIPTIHVMTVRSCIEALEKHMSGEQPLSFVTLDHDLGDYGPSEYDPNKRREFTGRDVVDWMVRFMDPNVDVRVHSWNIVGGAGMERALKEAGFKVYSRPYCFDENSTRDGGFNRHAKP